MRVTKVKVNDPSSGLSKMVLINRTVDKGALVLDGDQKDSTDDILNKCKNDSFILSILNRTIVNDKKFYKKYRNQNMNSNKKTYELVEKTIELIIKISLAGEKKLSTKNKINIKLIKKGVVKDCLTKKFRESISFKDDGGKVVSFDLFRLFTDYIESGDIKYLDKYAKWVKFYQKTKIEKLKKSITNNKIVVTDSTNDNPIKLSKKKRVLKKWSLLYKNSNDSSKILNERIDRLGVVFKLQKIINDCRNIDKLKYFNKKESSDKKLRIPKFNYLLKSNLQEHQKAIFGTNKEIYGGFENKGSDSIKDKNIIENVQSFIKNREDDELSIFNLEVAQYVEHYFPIKKKKKLLTEKEFDYYLNYNTIKKTVFHQIENAIVNYLMQDGRNNINKLDSNTSSQTLSAIKREEFFALNFVEICAFAANNLRNIIDKTQEKDILGCTDFFHSINNNNASGNLFKQFFGSDIKIDDEILWAIRGSVQQIRNALIHYNGNVVKIIFENEEFEFFKRAVKYDKDKRINKKYSDTRLKEVFKNDIDNLQNVIFNQFKSNEILKYYTLKDVNTLFGISALKLSKTVIAFAPGFKKVHALGLNIQKSNSKLKLTYYPACDKSTGMYQSCYFLLKFIYNNFFICYFLDDKNILFKKVVNQVLLINKKNAAKNEKKEAYAFNGIQSFEEAQGISSYLSNIHSALVQEQAKKGEQEDNIRYSYEKFLKQVFVLGFNNYLDENKLAFLKEFNVEEKEFKEEDYKLLKISVDKGILDANKDNQIAFFTLCKLLDASHLSDLRNELIKFKQTTNKTFSYDYLIGILDLCLLNVDTSVSYDNKDIVDFFEVNANLNEWGDLYFQSDNKTSIIHSNIGLLKKYGVIDLLKDVVKEHKITKVEYDRWKLVKDSIPAKIRKRDKLHKDWVRDSKSFDLEKRKTYSNLCKDIDEYVWLDNKLHFVHLKQLHNLMIEILARLSKFISLRDRDLMKIQSSLFGKEYNFKSSIKLDQFYELKLNKKCRYVLKNAEIKDKEINEKLDEKITKFENSCLNIVPKNDVKNFNKNRIYIAHYNYIGCHASHSILDLINYTRALMQYDRKLKNAVTKSIINIFDKHGMNLKFKLDNNHNIALYNVRSKVIKHLAAKERYEKSTDKNKKLLKTTTDQVNEEYCSMCKSLLEFKK